MATRFIEPGVAKNDNSMGIFGPALALMSIAGVAGLIWFLLTTTIGEGLTYFFLVPWILGLAIVQAIPLIVLYYQGKLRFDNPIVFATFSYLFPAFVIGGLMLALGFSKPYFLQFILDPQENLPYTIIVIAVGHTGFVLGYFFSLANRFGKYLSKFMPEGNTDPSAAFLPGFLLLGLGMINSIVGLIIGFIGYQLVEEASSYDGILYLTTMFWMQATFFLFYAVFKLGKYDLKTALVVVVVGSTAVIKALFAGNRGGLITMAMPVVMAYVMSGRTFKLRQFFIAATIGFLCLVVGMVYGTTFREVKGTEGNIDFGNYADNIGKTFSQVGRNDNIEILQFGFNILRKGSIPFLPSPSWFLHTSKCNLMKRVTD